MKNGWTGGQYSLVRAITGICLLIRFATLLPSESEILAVEDSQAVASALIALALVASCFFMAGFLDRVAAVVIAGVLTCLFAGNPPIVSPALLFVWWFLIVHAFLPPAPFGSVAARGRVDPRGGWHFPPALFLATRIVIALVLLHGTLRILLGSAHLTLGMFVVPLFAFDPGWIRGTRPGTTDIFFFDGTCGLCHRGVRFCLAEDRTATAFRIAPIGGDLFTATMGDARAYPDSVIVRTADGTTLVQSAAFLHLFKRLGGFWRVLASAASALPRPLRDGAYDLLARVRYRLFGTAKESCPLLPPDLRSRFVA